MKDVIQALDYLEKIEELGIFGYNKHLIELRAELEDRLTLPIDDDDYQQRLRDIRKF